MVCQDLILATLYSWIIVVFTCARVCNLDKVKSASYIHTYLQYVGWGGGGTVVVKTRDHAIEMNTCRCVSYIHQ